MQTVRYCNDHTTHTRPDKLTTQKEHEQREIVLLNLGIVHPAQTVLEELAHHVAARMGVHGRAHHLAGDRSSPSSILQPGVVWKCLLVVHANKLFQATRVAGWMSQASVEHYPWRGKRTSELMRALAAMETLHPHSKPMPSAAEKQTHKREAQQTSRSHRPPTHATFVTGIRHGSKSWGHARMTGRHTLPDKTHDHSWVSHTIRRQAVTTNRTIPMTARPITYSLTLSGNAGKSMGNKRPERAG